MPSGSGITLRTSAEADIPTPDTDQITFFNDSDLGNEPAFKDDTGTVTALRGEDGELTYQDHGNAGSTETVNATTANVHRLVLDSATLTITLAGAPASGTPGIVRLRLIQDGTGGRLVSWPGSVSWVTGVAPTLSTGAAAVDVIDLETEDGGTTWYGIMVGQRGATGSTGAAGVNGGAVTIPYTFSTTTTDSDPGAGVLRLSNATQTSATVIRADLLSSDGTDWTAILDTLADSTNTVKGHIRLFKTSDPTKWLVFRVSSLASPSGYRNITVVNVGGSASSPLANSDAITLAFTRAGDVGASGTASVGSDPIWDAAGDLAVGSGADTAVRLAKGVPGSELGQSNGALAWTAGTSFPGSPATGDRYFRTDILGGMEFRYDGTQWRSVQVFSQTIQIDNLSFAIDTPSTGISVGQEAGWTNVPFAGTYDIYVLSAYAVALVTTTNDGTKYWTCTLYKRTPAQAATSLGSFNTSAQTVNQAKAYSIAVNAAVVSSNSTHIYLGFNPGKTSTPGNLWVAATVLYQIIAT